MPTVRVTADALETHLSGWEKLAGLLRDVRVPLSAVRSVEVIPDGLTAARGLRAPGLGLPGRRKIGTWRGREGKTLVAVRRGQPALRIRLAGQGYDGLLVGADDAEAVAAALRTAIH